MENLPLLLGGSWASGVNLYLTMAALGIAHRMNWLQLPGNLEILSHPAVICVAIVLFLIEFVADKIPYVDSAWDSVHTFIRPVGGALLGFLALSGYGQEWQFPVALLTGAVAMESHLTKATLRAAINTSPEPITNSIASVSEDVSVLGVVFLIINHPVVASFVILGLMIISVWFLIKMFHIVKRMFTPRKTKEFNSDSL